MLLEDEATYNDLVEDAPVPVVPCMRRWLGKLNSLGTGIKYHASTDFALKRHMDLKVDNCGYIFVPEKLVKPIPPSCENPPLEMIDIAKHRAILEEITRARKKAWRAYDFERLGKLAWIFTYHVPGRTAFCKRTVADGPIRNSSYTEESVATAGAGQFHGEEDISSAETSIYKKNDESSPRSSTNTKIYQEPKVGVNKGLGELDWVSEIVERRILEVAAWNAL